MKKKMVYNLNLPIYHAGTDMLYATIDDGTLDYAYEIEDVDDVTLMWDEDGKLTGVEIRGFKERFLKLPATVRAASEKGDVELVIERINDNFDEKNIEYLMSRRKAEDMPATAWRPNEPGWCEKSPEVHVSDESRRICAEMLLRFVD